MIIANSADEFRCITQHEHGKIAGTCAMQWGNEEFGSVTPEGTVVTATFTHDIGWQEFDQRPRTESGGERGGCTPVNFHEVPAQTWVEMYEQGIETVADLDPYAGLLVSLHGVGLQNGRYGLTPEWGEPEAAFHEFIRRERERQSELAEQISERDAPSLSEADRATLRRLQEDARKPEQYTGRLWCNYKRLQTWDTLSHILCATAEQGGETTIEHTPVSVDTDVSIAVRSDAPNTYQIEPYPFTSDPLVLPVTVRTVSEQTIRSGNEQAIAREYFTNTDSIEFRVHS